MRVYGIFSIIGYVNEWQIGEGRYEVMCGRQRRWTLLIVKVIYDQVVKEGFFVYCAD